jgi:hypothetical protein
MHFRRAHVPKTQRIIIGLGEDPIKLAAREALA